jgi:regulator of replication initiation timing
MTKKKEITDETEKVICRQIDILAARSTNGKVTWKQIAGVAGFSRVSLSKNTNIVNAYNAVNGITKARKTVEEENEELKIELAKLKMQRDKHKETIKRYDEKYIRWLYNATNANITVEQLNAPVPHSMKTSERLKSVK